MNLKCLIKGHDKIVAHSQPFGITDTNIVWHCVRCKKSGLKVMKYVTMSKSDAITAIEGRKENKDE